MQEPTHLRLEWCVYIEWTSTSVSTVYIATTISALIHNVLLLSPIVNGLYMQMTGFEYTAQQLCILSNCTKKSCSRNQKLHIVYVVTALVDGIHWISNTTSVLKMQHCNEARKVRQCPANSLCFTTIWTILCNTLPSQFILLLYIHHSLPLSSQLQHLYNICWRRMWGLMMHVKIETKSSGSMASLQQLLCKVIMSLYIQEDHFA